MLSHTTAIAKAWARLDPKSDLMNQNLLKQKTPLDSDNGYSRSWAVLMAHLLNDKGELGHNSSPPFSAATISEREKWGGLGDPFSHPLA